MEITPIQWLHKKVQKLERKYQTVAFRYYPIDNFHYILITPNPIENDEEFRQRTNKIKKEFRSFFKGNFIRIRFKREI